MDTAVSRQLRRMGAWCGMGYLAAVLGGWALVAGFIPPHNPADSAEQIAAIFQEDTTRIRIGMLFVMLAALLMIPFAGVISQALARVEGGAGVLTYTALLGGVGNMVLTFYPAIWWLVAAYRPGRGVGHVYLMNDMAWLQLIGGVTMFLALPLSIALGAFVDNSTSPVFPRWAGYFNIWICVLIIPDQLLFFFHSGPFAWNGLFGLWLPVTSFAAWFVVTFVLLTRDIGRSATGSVNTSETSTTTAQAM